MRICAWNTIRKHPRTHRRWDVFDTDDADAAALLKNGDAITLDEKHKREKAALDKARKERPQVPVVATETGSPEAVGEATGTDKMPAAKAPVPQETTAKK